MKTVLKYLRSYKKEMVLAPLFKLLEACFELFVPLVVASIIDVGVKGNDARHILRGCIVMAILGLVGLICAVAAQFFAAKAATGFGRRVRGALFGHIQTLSYSELDQTGTSALITGMTSDVNQIQTGVNLVLRLFLRSPVIVFGAMIMAFTVDAPSAVHFVVLIPALSVVVFGIMLISIPLYKKVQKLLDKVLGTTRENLNGVRVVRAFHNEQKEIERFDNANEALNVAQRFVGRISALMNPLTYAIVNITIVLLINGGAMRVNEGAISQGELIALYNYMTQILVELVKLANLIITVTKAVACGNRVGEMLTSHSSEQPNAEATASLAPHTPFSLDFRNVSLRYRGAGDDSLSDISFSVGAGETLGIIGGTGSGKTSAVNMIPGFYPATSGEILLDGKPIGEYDMENLRNVIGVVAQKATLFKGTVRKNLLWGDEGADEQTLLDALEAAQAKDFVLQKEGGLDATVEQGGRNFSGGQKQRLSIARALVRRPSLLILDDSASALDYATEAALGKAIQNLPYKPTTVIVSQRASSLMHADKILVLHDGEAVGYGKHSDLLVSCPIYKEIYDSQFSSDNGKEASV